jgi:hypothetical protein
MNPTLRNILGFILGWIGGSAINMALINTGHSVFPIEGLDPNDMNSLAEIMPTLAPEYFLFPFLAHALGTFSGAILGGLIAAKNKMKIALAIGSFFLVGGIVVNLMIPGPLWFASADILLAYIPMAFLGGKISLQFSKEKN